MLQHLRGPSARPPVFCKPCLECPASFPNVSTNAATILPILLTYCLFGLYVLRKLLFDVTLVKIDWCMQKLTILQCFTSSSHGAKHKPLTMHVEHSPILLTGKLVEPQIAN